MEYEVRYYFSKKQLDNIIDKLNHRSDLSCTKKLYEKTMQFDHPCTDMSFYNKKIDGRFRIRISKNEDVSKCKISWKRRIPTTMASDVNKEEEIELNIKYEEYENLMFLIRNVLKMKNIESYERYRTIYSNDEIEISIDEYPFGIALEIESRGNSNSQKTVRKWVNLLDLDIKKAYRLSWDDKYVELCKEQNVEVFKEVLFDLPMPEVLENEL